MVDKSKRAKEAATELARLVERQLNYPDGRIDSVALRLFLRAYWVRRRGRDAWARPTFDQDQP
jgi:hypothetical protein